MKYSPKEKTHKNQKIENLLSNYKKIWGNEQAQDENKDIFNSYFVPREEIDI